MDLLEGLNPEQREAVITTEGPLLIVAGAGSGKTRALTHRVAYIIAKGVAPWNILAVTFTNKAAREMKERVESLVGPQGQDVWVSTFHSLCVRILRRDIDRLGYEKSFSILDSSDQLSLIKKLLKQENLDPKTNNPNAILSHISGAKNELKTVRDYEKTAYNYFEKVVARIYELYQNQLKINNALDFDDLIMLTVRLLDTNPDVLYHYQEKFRYIHIDEYQDTNRAQYYLVKLLAAQHQNICVVGDSDQSIYKWRGADIHNILNFEKDYENTKVITLERNYRSTDKILQAANAVIKNNRQRKDKKLWTEETGGDLIKLYQAYNETQEAYYVTEEILKARDAGLDYQDIAILYRTNAQSRIFEDTLLKSNIPYVIVGGHKFYDRKEIKDILAYLRLIANPKDDISLIRIINVPRRGIGDTTVDRLIEYASQAGLSIYEACHDLSESGLSKGTLTKVISFIAMITNLRSMQEFLTVTELVEELLKVSLYVEELEKEASLESESRIENIKEFLTVTQDFEKVSEDKSLISFLTDLALIADIDKLEEDEKALADGGGQVVLMTLHSAKGLEFPLVFLTGLEEGVFPHIRSLMEDEEMEEERRLCYVGITRAERQLHLTYARMRRLYGRENYNLPARFLEEIPTEVLEVVGSETGGDDFYDESYQDWGYQSQSYRGQGSGYQRSGQRGNTQVGYGGSAKSGYAGRTSLNKGSSASSVSSVSKQKAAATAGADLSQDWPVSGKVQHKNWGVGTIISKQGEGEKLELTIAFPAPTGIKKLLAKFAPIEKI